jgi:hypothetical protein
VLPCDSRDHELFAASTVVTVGDGRITCFWTSSWIEGVTTKVSCAVFVPERKEKKITIQKTLKIIDRSHTSFPLKRHMKFGSMQYYGKIYMESRYKKIMMIPYNGV